MGRFISADDIAPGKDNPQNRNRYSYALNNPLTFTDPTGHCAEGYDETLEGCITYLNDHGWNLTPWSWEYDMLNEFAQSIADLKTAAHWGATDYYNTMSNNGEYSLVLEHRAGYSLDANRPADTSVRDGAIVLAIYDYGINRFASPEGRIATYVHEQAHVWDIASDGTGKKELSVRAGGYTYTDTGTGKMRYGTRDQQPTNYSGSSDAEDWAETVAASVYPEFASRPMGPEHTAVAQKYLANPHTGGTSTSAR